MKKYKEREINRERERDRSPEGDSLTETIGDGDACKNLATPHKNPPPSLLCIKRQEQEQEQEQEKPDPQLVTLPFAISDLIMYFTAKQIIEWPPPRPPLPPPSPPPLPLPRPLLRLQREMETVAAVGIRRGGLGKYENEEEE